MLTSICLFKFPVPRKETTCTYNVPPSLPLLHMSQAHIPSVSIEFDRVFRFGCPHIDRHTCAILYRGTTYRRRHGGLCRRDKHRGAVDSKAPADNPLHSGVPVWVRELIFNRVWPLELSLGFSFSAMHLSSRNGYHCPRLRLRLRLHLQP